MEEGRMASSGGRREGRGVNQGLAAVIALTLAFAAALQAGFARLATQSAIAAVIAGEGAATGDVRAGEGRAASDLKKLIARVAAAIRVEPAATCGREESVVDVAGACRAGLGAMPPPVV